MENIRKIKSISRYFLKLLDQSYTKYLLSNASCLHQLPTEDQYCQLKQYLILMSSHAEVNVDQIDTVFDTVGAVLGNEQVKTVDNNVLGIKNSKSWENFQEQSSLETDRQKDGNWIFRN